MTDFNDKYKSFKINGEVLLSNNLEIVGKGELKYWCRDHWQVDGNDYNREFSLVRLDEIFTGFGDIEIFQNGTKVKLGSLKHVDVIWPTTDIVFNFLDTEITCVEPFSSQNFLNWFKIFKRRNFTQSTITSSNNKVFGNAADIENQMLDDDLLIGANTSKSSNVFFRSLLAKSHVSNLMGYVNHSAQFIDLTLQMKQSHIMVRDLIRKANRVLDYYFDKYSSISIQLKKPPRID